MTNGEGIDYATWRHSISEPDELDVSASSDQGSWSAQLSEFAEEVFRDRGPISRAEFDQAYNERQLLLARRAVELVEADIERAAGFAAMKFDVDIRTIDDEFELVVSYRGSYQTPVMSSLRTPEATAEVADYLQDLIQDEISSAWPVCPGHDRGLYAQVDHGDAVWYCRSGQHPVGKIGELGLQSA